MSDRPRKRAPDWVDQDRLENAVREILLAVGEDPQRDGLLDTPARVARMYGEVLSGQQLDPARHLEVTFAEDHHEMVVVKDIAFDSLCEHHMLPFFGRCHIGYIPDGQVIGVSKLARISDMFGRRLQIQERLTHEIATAVYEMVKPHGVGVVMEARHLCMMMRGVEKQNSCMVSSAMLGNFLDSDRTRSEFLQLVGHRSRA